MADDIHRLSRHDWAASDLPPFEWPRDPPRDRGVGALEVWFPNFPQIEHEAGQEGIS
jgi:hypothetical protein